MQLHQPHGGQASEDTLKYMRIMRRFACLLITSSCCIFSVNNQVSLNIFTSLPKSLQKSCSFYVFWHWQVVYSAAAIAGEPA